MKIKCKKCGVQLSNCQGGDRLKINDDAGIRCISCSSVHSWATGNLIHHSKPALYSMKLGGGEMK